MIIDFTLNAYKSLLQNLQKSAYVFFTFEEYCTKKSECKTEQKLVILRHDVDLKPENSLQTAKIENQLGIKATYYFRVIPDSNNPDIIKSIAALGHEIGYHYEDMSLYNGDAEKAIKHFEKQIEYFRQFYPVKTICMHGAPQSKYDGKDLWKKYDYHDFGIIGEPYFDTDFSDFFYITDTGRMWDRYNVSVRDKIPVHQDRWISQGLVYHYTKDICKAIDLGTFPKRMMITTHPQRWTNNTIEWMRELLLQNVKNVIKFLIKRMKKSISSLH